MPRGTVKNIRTTFINRRGHKKARVANIAKANAARLGESTHSGRRITPNILIPKPIQRPKSVTEPIKAAAKGKRIRKSEIQQEFEAQKKYKDLASFKKARANVLAKKRMERHRDRSFEKKKVASIKAISEGRDFLRSLPRRSGLEFCAAIPLHAVEQALYRAERLTKTRRIKKKQANDRERRRKRREKALYKKHPELRPKTPAKKKLTRNRPRVADSRRSIRAIRKKLIEREYEFPNMPPVLYQRAFLYNRQLADGSFRSAKRKAFRSVPVTAEFMAAQARNKDKQKGRDVTSRVRKRRYCPRPRKSARVN